MLTRVFSLLLLACWCTPAQIGLPRAGCFCDAAGRLRSVFGLAGNFVIGEPERAGVLAAACSGRLTVLKLPDAIEVRRGDELLYRYDAAPGPALFAFSPRGDEALAWLPESAELLKLTAAAVTRLTPRSIVTVLRGESEAPVLLRPDGTLACARDRELVLGDAVVPLPGRAVSLENLGPRFVRVVLADGAGHLALESREDAWVVWRLPEVAP